MNGLEEAIEIFGRVAKAEIAELHERIAELLDQLEASDREKELLRARIEELDGEVGVETWVGSGQGVREASAQHHPPVAEDAVDLSIESSAEEQRPEINPVVLRQSEAGIEPAAEASPSEED